MLQGPHNTLKQFIPYLHPLMRAMRSIHAFRLDVFISKVSRSHLEILNKHLHCVLHTLYSIRALGTASVHARTTLPASEHAGFQSDALQPRHVSRSAVHLNSRSCHVSQITFHCNANPENLAFPNDRRHARSLYPEHLAIRAAYHCC